MRVEGLSVGGIPEPPALSDAAAAVRTRIMAREELTRLERPRFVAHCLAEAQPRARIGALLGVSVMTVDRLVRQVHANPEVGEVTATEVICRAAVGEISREHMFDTLGQMVFTFGQSDPTGHEGYRRGTWDQVEAALGNGLLTDAEYAELCSRERR